ncbi:MFS transporter [Streptomyces cacaoi]|uniref:MFS transporter n=1 Tax=Streptomyces cacaoi TaxID=1898 RepID=UPI002632ABA2|nr:MFS transporter [Streptomyces cacaoi]
MSTAPPPAPGSAPPGAHPLRWAAAVVLMVAALMDMVDVTIVNVALPSIGRDLAAPESALQWLMSAYMLGFAGTLIVSGHLGDRYGRKPLFLTGTALFGLASLTCGIAQTPGQLVAARAVQGVAAALVMPQVLGAFRTLFHGRERGAAFGMYGGVAGFASAIGLLLGGVLTDADLFGWGWRSIFLINVPVAAVTLVAGVLLVPSVGERSARRPDLPGSLLLAGGLVAVVLPLVQGESWGWPVWGWLCMAAGVLAVLGLAVLEPRRRSARQGRTAPLLPARAFRNGAFSTGLVVQLLFAVGMQGFFLVLTLWLQAGQGYTPLQAGVVTVAFAVGGFLTAPVAGALAVRFGRLVLVAGAALMAVGYGLVWLAVDGSAAAHTGAWPLVPGLLLAGAGLGFLVVPLVDVVLSAVPAGIAGAASGIFTTGQQFGGAVGVGAIGAAFFDRTRDGLTDAFLHAAPWALAAAVACALLCLWLPRTAVTEEEREAVAEGAADEAAGEAAGGASAEAAGKADTGAVVTGPVG